MAFKNRDEVAAKVGNEGLSDFLLEYTSAESMPDDEMKKAFEKAVDALHQFLALLPEEWQED